VGFKFTDKDRGFNEIKRAAKNGSAIAVAGIQGEKASAPHDAFGNRNVDIAVFHEFGTRTAPQRSFIRSSVDRNRDKYGKLIEGVAGKILDGDQAKRAMGRLAQVMAADMVATIDNSIDLEPLAESTVLARSAKRNRSGLQNLALGAAAAAGGGEKPLLDTAQLKLSITGTVK